MNSKHLKTLKLVFETPVKSNIPWKDIESLLTSLASLKEEGNGSRIRFIVNGVFATFHRPHPGKETDRGAVVSVKRFLINAGVKPC